MCIGSRIFTLFEMLYAYLFASVDTRVCMHINNVQDKLHECSCYKMFI